MAYYIRKSDGTKQEFNIKKFRKSLKKSGASDHIVNKIVEEIFKQKPTSTKAIHAIAAQLLGNVQPSFKARYNLKRAIMELGPSGFPFEKFVAEIFNAQGYKTIVGQVIPGACVEHEIDVIAENSNNHFMVECKFHNRTGLKSDVKVALYIQARFEDIKRAWKQNPNHPEELHKAWMVTNTRFTSVAEKYAHCMDMQMLAWSWPHGGIQALIDKFDLHPITALTLLDKKQKKEFIKNDLVLCRDTEKNRDLLTNMHFSENKIKNIIQEANAICELGHRDKD